MVYELIEKYYKNNPPLRKILLTHSEQVKNKAMRVIQQHPYWQVDVELVANGSLLHDIGIFLCDAPKIQCFGPHLYIEHGYLGAEILRKEGLPQYARIAERHTGAGLTKQQIEEQNLPLPKQDFLPETLEEKIICYADKFFSKSHLGEESSWQKIETTMAKFGYGASERWNKLVNLMR